MIRDLIQDEVFQALEALQIEVNKTDILIDHPADLQFGDYSTNVAMVLAKKLGQNPKELAEKITAQLVEQKNDSISKVVAVGAFINFFLSGNFLSESVSEILAKKDDFGRGETKNKKVLVEYSSPNIAKPLNIGHMRSTIIGDAVANILAFCGNEIIRDNHLGDWGTQFGKQIVAIKKWGDEEKISQSENPIKELVALYVKFHEEAEKEPSLEDEARAWVVRLEKGDDEAVALWKKIIDWSMIEIQSIYDLMGVKFDTYLGESFYIDKIEEVYKALTEKNLMHQSEGADLVFFEGDKLPPMIVRKKDGSSIYATRDLAADLYRKQTYGDDVVIVNEVGGEQALYFKQLFQTEEMLGWFKPGQRVHIGHGLYRFKEGKMSTRKGLVIWVEDVFREAITRAETFNKEGATDVAIGALKYNDLKRDSSASITFDWEEVLNLKGNSGPYLQYAYARTQSILAKAEKEGIKPEVSVVDEITNVEKLLYRFPEVVARAGQEYAPHYIATYLYEIASAFSSYYTDHHVVSVESNSPYRVALTEAVGIVLKNGLKLLGIKAPEKM